MANPAPCAGPTRACPRAIKILFARPCNGRRIAPSSGSLIRYRTMHAQLITYQLKDISQAEYLKQMVEPDAPILAGVKGLISKVWLADIEKNTFGGFYLWENKTAMEDFMNSDLVKAVVSRPFVKNVSSVDFEVNQNASLITRGLK